MPDDRPKFETIPETEARSLATVEALFNRATDIAATLEACRKGARCGSSNCPVCAGFYRLPVIRAAVRIANSTHGNHEWATIYLATIAVDSLPDVKLKLVREAFRKRLKRSGFAGSILIGGIEVTWLARDRVWILHAHLTAIHVPQGAWDSLREKLTDSGRDTPLKVVDLKSPERQISYSIKFVSYYRPGQIGREGRARAYPLPQDRLAELATWRSQYDFGDFLFLFGARRRGGQFVVES